MRRKSLALARFHSQKHPQSRARYWQSSLLRLSFTKKIGGKPAEERYAAMFPMRRVAA